MMPVNIQQDSSVNLQSGSEVSYHSSQQFFSNVKMEEEVTDFKIALSPVPDKCGPPTISLALLIDFAIQQTYHDLTILTELLPKKKSTDRKISIVQFAHSTRTIFMKLLAIVKWIRISKRFEPLAAMRYFLEQQANIFVDTADRLVLIARDELRFARLPIFQVPPAVDILTLGAYPRLPQNIKDRFIFKPVLSHSEQVLTLYRINHILEYQLLRIANTLSPRFDSVLIKNGMVTLKVSGEFELCLTIVDENEPIHWCLLNVIILVENTEVGYGQKLVHPLQIHFIHQILQQKLDKSSLHDAYVVIHSFCQSIQLDVLHCQAYQMSLISPFYLRVEEYDRTKMKLVISYWLRYNNKKKLISPYKIVIFGDTENVHSSLKTRHHPSSEYLPSLGENDDKCLSISRLIGETIVLRCRESLLEVKDILESVPPFTEVNQTGNALLTLNYSLISIGKQFKDESLEISMDNFLGTIVCQIKVLGRIEEIVQLERLLNNTSPSTDSIVKILNRLRVLVMIERFHKTVCGLQVQNLNNQMIAEAQVLPILKKLKDFPIDRRILQFNREEQYFLVVTFLPDEKNGISLDFYLISLSNGKSNIMQLNAEELIKSAPIPTIGLMLDLKDQKICAEKCNKAKMKWIGSHKQLQVAIASIDDRLVFLSISEELDKRGIKYKPLSVEPLIGGHLIQVVNLKSFFSSASSSTMSISDSKYCDDFFKNLVSCSLRLDLRQNLSWPFECTMINCPVVADSCTYLRTESDLKSFTNPSSKKNKTSCTWVQHITSQSTNTLTISEAVTYNIVERLSIYCHVYGPVKQFSYAYESYLNKFCTVQVYTYHKLVLAYGEDRNYLLILSWRPRHVTRKAQYVLNFGQCENRNTIMKNKKRWNPHILMTTVLTEQFNQNHDLISLVWYLINTYRSLETIYNFSRMKIHSVKAISQVLNIDAMFPVELQCHLNVISSHKLRLTYGSTHIEFFLLANNYTGVRECFSNSMQLNNNRMLGASPLPDYSSVTSNSTSFDAFWRRISNGTLSLSSSFNSVNDINTGNNLLWQKSPAIDLKIDSPYHISPKSFPSQVSGANGNTSGIINTSNSPLSTIPQRMTLSVPNSMTIDGNASTSYASDNSFLNNQSTINQPTDHTSTNIVVSHSILKRAMCSLSANSPSALENYLYGTIYLSRLHSVIDASRRAIGVNHLPVREVQCNLLVREQPQLLITILCYQLPNIPTKDPCLLRIRFFVNHMDNFKLKVKLEYNGSSMPAESDVLIFERYFETHVTELFNEIAVLTFITLCRLGSSPNIFSSFAQLMLAQLEPKIDTHWLFNLQLTTWSSANERKIQCGIIVSESCKQFLIMIAFRSKSKTQSSQIITDRKFINSERRQLTLVYDVLNNDLSLRQQQNNSGNTSGFSGAIDEAEIINILKTQSQNCNSVGIIPNVCSIWSCICGIYDGFNNAMAAIKASNAI